MSILVPKRKPWITYCLRKTDRAFGLTMSSKRPQPIDSALPNLSAFKGWRTELKLLRLESLVQGNLSILTLRSPLLSQSSSIWQFIFVEFCNLDPGPARLWDVSSFLLAPQMHGTQGKTYLLLRDSQAPGSLEWNGWNGISKELNVSG